MEPTIHGYTYSEILGMLDINPSVRKCARETGIPKSTLQDFLKRNQYKPMSDLHAPLYSRVNTGRVALPPVPGDVVDLFIADMQIPFQHPDAVDYLQWLKDTFQPQRVFNVGDLVDYYNFSRYDRSPDAPSSRHELAKIRKTVKELGRIFPEMYIAYGNHDARLEKLVNKFNIPAECLRPINELIGAPPGWKWAERWNIQLPGSTEVMMVHDSGSSDVLKGVQSYGCSIVQGHYDTIAEIKYLSTRRELLFGMSVGSLIDKDAIAFHYNKLKVKRPIISSGLLINGQPMLVPMPL